MYFEILCYRKNFPIWCRNYFRNTCVSMARCYFRTESFIGCFRWLTQWNLGIFFHSIISCIFLVPILDFRHFSIYHLEIPAFDWLLLFANKINSIGKVLILIFFFSRVRAQWWGCKGTTWKYLIGEFAEF